jgi:hypothetical protein
MERIMIRDIWRRRYEYKTTGRTFIDLGCGPQIVEAGEIVSLRCAPNAVLVPIGWLAKIRKILWLVHQWERKRYHTLDAPMLRTKAIAAAVEKGFAQVPVDLLATASEPIAPVFRLRNFYDLPRRKWMISR